MPFTDLPLSAKPVDLIASVFTTALLPEFMSPLGDLFFEALVLIHVEDRGGVFVICRLFHGGGVGVKRRSSRNPS